MNETAISDSSCLIALDKIGRLDLLSQSFNAIIVPSAVQNEFGLRKDWLKVKSVLDIELVISLKTQIDDGEAEVIALAMEMGNVYVIIDDKKARRVAKQIKLKVLGTVGLVLRAKKKNIITEVKPILSSLQNVDFRISDTLYREALRLAGET